MNLAINNSGEFLGQISSRASTPGLALPLVQIPQNHRRQETFSGHQRPIEPLDLDIQDESGQIPDASCQPAIDSSEAVVFSVALLAVVGLAATWGWAIVQLARLLVQAQSLVIENAFLALR